MQHARFALVLALLGCEHPCKCGVRIGCSTVADAGEASFTYPYEPADMLEIAEGEWMIHSTDAPAFEGTLRVEAEADRPPRFGSSSEPENYLSCAGTWVPVRLGIETAQPGYEPVLATELFGEDTLDYELSKGRSERCVRAGYGRPERQYMPLSFLLCEDGSLWLYADPPKRVGSKL